MTKWIPRVLLAAVLAGVGWWAWHVLFPSPERVIRRELSRLAELAEVRANEAPLSKLSKAHSICDLFTPDTELVLNVPGHSDRTIQGKDELLEAVLGSRSTLETLTVDFVDVTVTVEPGGEAASVLLTAKATVSGQKNFFAQELAFSWRKVSARSWLIRRVETVKTLL